ncbi:antitoxin [Saccharopolyspora rhizosphaerae]|uniref:Antitoxin n=1 Tax=Saccharopolyspora rhizosphaerae TaxID=2492662 RepID=A0A426JPJ6_9PSEU|nr:antitoxin [Saccharopolyspora rhizosphaerae]RRO15119.1 antitoxin [Saccharopolyspora rhizosphaerae]
MGFGDFKDKLQGLSEEHGDKVEQGMDKAGDKAKEKYGHDEQVDQAVEKGKDYVGGDEEQPPPPPGQ